VPYYNKTLNYHPLAHINGNGTIVQEFYYIKKREK
jgi:hypothetical protein